MIFAINSLQSSSSALSTLQTVCKLVTPTATTASRIPFVFNIRLYHRSRWSPVVFQRKMPFIPFLFMPLRGSFLHDEGGYTPLPIAASPRVLLTTYRSHFDTTHPEQGDVTIRSVYQPHICSSTYERDLPARPGKAAALKLLLPFTRQRVRLLFGSRRLNVVR